MTQLETSKQEKLTTYANEIEAGLWLGSEDAGQLDLSILKSNNISSILVCGFGLSCKYENTDSIIYKKLKLIDLPICQLNKHLNEAIIFLNNNFDNKNNKNVLIHCARGVSRSASIVTGYLMNKYNISYQEAYYRVRSKRKCVSINHGFEKQLIEYQKTLNLKNNKKN